MAPTVLTFGEFELDVGAFELRRNGRAVRIERLPMELLLLLVERRGQLVTRQDIVDRLWGPDVFVDVDTGVNTAVRKVRQALRDDPNEPKYLQTVTGKGYRFVATVVAPEPELQPATMVAEPPPPATIAPRPPRRWRWRAAALAAVGLLGAAVAIARLAREPALTDRDTVVVADFVNTTGEPVFDGTLKQALTIDLEQTPFLSIVPGDRVRGTLALMTRSPEERVIGHVARELCQRVGAAMTIQGSIAALGSRYLVALESANCETGERMASDRAEAAGRDQVLKTLDGVIVRHRRKLGESRAQLRRFSTPIEEATTSSLEALKAFTLGEEARAHDGDEAAVPFFRKAIELDPEFALAYARLATTYSNLGRFADVASLSREARLRRDRVSEHERLSIDAEACREAANQRRCLIDLYELWRQTYPRDLTPYNNLCLFYNAAGRFDEALASGLAATRLQPDHVFPYLNLAETYIVLGRLADARVIAAQAVARKLYDPDLPVLSFQLAYAAGDTAAMAAERQRVAGRPEEVRLAIAQAEIEASRGHLRAAHEAMARAVELALIHGPDGVSSVHARGALIAAVVGDVARARAPLAQLAPSASAANIDATMAAVLAGDRAQAAKRLAAPEAGLRPPLRTTLHVARALLDIDSGDRTAAGRIPPPESGELLPGAQLLPIYLRGLAYLRAGAADRGVAEFQRIVDHPLVVPQSPLHALAVLQQARAFALAGDLTRARAAYEQFLDRWKDADADVPVLRRARAEYARLTAPATRAHR